jgi:hypothetical protein
MPTHFQCFHIPAVIFQQFPHICTEFYTHICWNDSIRHQLVIMVSLAEFMAKVLIQMSVELLCFLLLKKCCRPTWQSYVVAEIITSTFWKWDINPFLKSAGRLLIYIFMYKSAVKSLPLHDDVLSGTSLLFVDLDISTGSLHCGTTDGRNVKPRYIPPPHSLTHTFCHLQLIGIRLEIKQWKGVEF